MTATMSGLLHTNATRDAALAWMASDPVREDKMKTWIEEEVIRAYIQWLAKQS